MNIRVKHTIVSTLMSFLFLLTTGSIHGAVSANRSVSVSCEGNNILVVADKKNFQILASGYPASFVTNVEVKAQPGWELESPKILPVKMKGGDAEEYSAQSDPEDNLDGQISFHCYNIQGSENEFCLLSEDRKQLEAPFGAEVTFLSERNGKLCASDWEINYMETNRTEKITFTSSDLFFPDWYLPSFQTPRPGLYSIHAHCTEEPKLQDNGQLTIFGARFEKAAHHDFGFDDYTNWECQNIAPAEDYYGNKTGECIYPYISYAIDEAGYAYFRILPDQNGMREYTIIPEANFIRCFPTNTTHNAVIQFALTDGCTNVTSESNLFAKFRDLSLSRIRLVPLLKKFRSVAFICVNGTQPPLTELVGANEIFKQCAVTFTNAEEVTHYSYQKAPANSVWTSPELDELYYQAQLDDKISSLYNECDVIVFVIPGRDVIFDVGAWGSAPHRTIWLYEFAASATVFAHELGHLSSLPDEYIFNPDGTYIEGDDLSNLMNVFDENFSTGRLRYPQWIKVNQGNEYVGGNK